MGEINDYTLWDGRKQAGLPRPSRLQVVTWQLNVTVYPPSSAMRVTSAISDPVEQFQFHKAKFETFEWFQGQQAIVTQCHETMRAIGYITGMSKGI